MLVCVFLCMFAHETAGAARTRLSLRPLVLSRAAIDAKLGRIAPRDREAVSADTRCLKIESADIYRARMRHIPPRGHRPARPGDPVFQSTNDKAQRRRVLDTPLEPVIGLAEGETRWRSMTAYYGAAQCVTSNPTASRPPSRHPKTPRLAVEKLHVRRQRQQQARGHEMCEFHVEVPPEIEGLGRPPSSPD